MKHILVLLMLVVAFLLSSCKSKEYVTVPEYHTEYIVRTDSFVKWDSVLVRDSVYINKVGDTVVVSKVSYKDRWSYIYKTKLDTLIKRDSVYVPYPVERQLTKNEQRLMALGRQFISFLIVLVVIIAIFWYKNKKC